MLSRHRGHVIAWTFALLASSTSTAVAVPITFEVRMAHQIDLGRFDPADDFVDLAGSFNDWGDPLIVLADPDGDTIYSVTVDGFTPGETIEFKFRMDGVWDGREEFPGGGPNRVHTVDPQTNEILVWYGDDVPHVVDPDQIAWWNDRVFYEVFVRSFHDSDGDGIGDLPGLTQKLDYLNDGDPTTTDDLGITGLWLMPINDSPSYHGYDAVDYRAIDPDYGTLADLEVLLAAAHARGIKVIVDLVMNHCSTQHPWFVASGENDPVYRDWFRWSTYDPGYTGPWGQTVWHWHQTGWYYGLFWGGMPDLNYDHPPVKAEMFDTATWWLDEVGVDGFRLDAVLYIHEQGEQLENTPATFQFWQDFAAHVRTVDAEAMTVGEAWTSTDMVLNYVADERLDFCFEFDLAANLLSAAGDGNVSGLVAKASEVYDRYPHLQFGTFLTNHDQDRVIDALGYDRAAARVAAGLFLGLPGIPFVYYGEEIGMQGSGAHENIRRPMQWNDGPHAGFTTGTPWYPVAGDYGLYNVADELDDPGSLLRWYQRLIGVRNESSAMRRGEYAPLHSSHPSVMAFLRQDAQETVLVLANASTVPVVDAPLVLPAGRLMAGDYQLVDLLDPASVASVTIDAARRLSGLNAPARSVAMYRVDGVVGVPGTDLPAAGLQLAQNRPNPFNPITEIGFSLPHLMRVRLGVYDVRGHRVATLIEGVRRAGEHTARWDGRDHDGRAVAAGVYLARLEAGTGSRVVKMLLVE